MLKRTMPVSDSVVACQTAFGLRHICLLHFSSTVFPIITLYVYNPAYSLSRMGGAHGHNRHYNE
jgi:hypothetical protein